MDFFDDLPVASIVFIAGLILTVVAYLSNEINYIEACAAIGFVGAGTFGVGKVRNEAGRGVK